MLGLFGLLGLVISAVGVYGVMAYIVSQRISEIGVRMALGATKAKVIRMVLTTASRLVGAVWFSVGSARGISERRPRLSSFGLEPHDLRAFVAAILALSAAAIAASVIPARRAAGVDPTVALRGE